MIVDVMDELARRLRRVQLDNGRTLTVYSAAESGPGGIPEGINEAYPVAVLTLGPGTNEVRNMCRVHKYQVMVNILASGGYLALRAPGVLRAVDKVLDALAINIGLLNQTGNRTVTYAFAREHAGQDTQDWAEIGFAAVVIPVSIDERIELTASLGDEE